MRMSDWISDLCSSDLRYPPAPVQAADLAGQPAELLRIAHDVDVAEAAVAFVTEGHRRADGIPLVEHQAEGAVDLLPHLTPARPGAAEHLGDEAHDLRGPAQPAVRRRPRPAERRVGKGGASTWRSRWAAYLNLK